VREVVPMEKEDTKITWIKCPECGAKIGIIISVGRGLKEETAQQPATVEEESFPSALTPVTGLQERLAASGIDLSLLDIQESEELTVIRPKRFLGDAWGKVNDAIRASGGVWVREGRESRWEIQKQETD